MWLLSKRCVSQCFSQEAYCTSMPLLLQKKGLTKSDSVVKLTKQGMVSKLDLEVLYMYVLCRLQHSRRVRVTLQLTQTLKTAVNL